MSDPDHATPGPFYIETDEFLDRRALEEPDTEALSRRYAPDGQRPPDALDADAIHAEMERMVFMVLSVRRSVRLAAEGLAWFPGPRVHGVLGQIALVTRTSLELAYHLCTYAPEVLRLLPDDEIHDWVIALLEVYDHSGTQGCIRTMQDLEAYAHGLREPFGDDLDIDAIVAAYADSIRGLDVSDRLFQRRRKHERNIAVLFMVAMSGSTKGWINDVERESMVLLCESLELLGDRYAIYGFSGFTHMRCELFRIKDFADAYDEQVHARISGILPQDYTRMGVTIRHLTKKLLAVDARTRVLITLSDGRPDDEDGYRGDYGIEDTRQAVLEARSQGVHPFCITIDDEAQDYLPHMFGPSSYTVVEDVAKLPYRVSDIYRRITV